MKELVFVELKELIGKNFVRVVSSKDNMELYFISGEGKSYMFYHEQDCCECVSIEDICGDLSDLEGVEILQAEEASCRDFEEQNDSDCFDDSNTWTFYKFATSKGYVTVRWLGSSNGYYSESVDMKEITKEEAIGYLSKE